MLYKGDTLYLNWLEDGIAELVFDAPGSVNKLDTATVASLGEALDVLEKQPELKGLLLRSNKAAFIVGADITEFLSLFPAPEEQLSQWLHFANSVFNRLEDLPVPTISAVNGYALGGGCECVLATDYRVATPDLRIGLPETKLGIMPGFGGSVRMPRLLGADSALEIIAAGKDVGAEQALKIGLVDGVVEPEKLVEGALAILRQAINGDLDWKAKRQPKLEPLKLSKIEAAMSFTIAKGMVMQTAGKHYPAPITAVKTIEAAAQLGRDEALKLENRQLCAAGAYQRGPRAGRHLPERSVREGPSEKADQKRGDAKTGGGTGRRHYGRRHRLPVGLERRAGGDERHQREIPDAGHDRSGQAAE